MKAVRQIHIINAQWNFSTIEQIIGRGIRHCSHNGLVGENRNVYVFKYVSSEPGKKYKESAEEKIYREIEKAHVTVKKIERALKESAVDCVLNKKVMYFRMRLKNQKIVMTQKIINYVIENVIIWNVIINVIMNY